MDKWINPEVAINAEAKFSAQRLANPQTACASLKWTTRWCGSQVGGDNEVLAQKGAFIWTQTQYGDYGELVMYVGPNESDMQMARILVNLHNNQIDLMYNFMDNISA